MYRELRRKDGTTLKIRPKGHPSPANVSLELDQEMEELLNECKIKSVYAKTSLN